MITTFAEPLKNTENDVEGGGEEKICSTSMRNSQEATQNEAIQFLQQVKRHQSANMCLMWVCCSSPSGIIPPSSQALGKWKTTGGLLRRKRAERNQNGSISQKLSKETHQFITCPGMTGQMTPGRSNSKENCLPVNCSFRGTCCVENLPISGRGRSVCIFFCLKQKQTWAAA